MILYVVSLLTLILSFSFSYLFATPPLGSKLFGNIDNLWELSLEGPADLVSSAG